MREPLKKCPECGGRLKLVENADQEYCRQECTACDYVIDLRTGEESHIHIDKHVVVRCPSCDSYIITNADYMSYKKPVMECPCCSTTFDLPDTVDPDINTIELCPHCGKQNTIPANKGQLNVTCGHCGKKFSFYSGEKELLYEDQNICPECGGVLEGVRVDGITVKQCTQCDYAVNTETGEVFHYALDEKYIVAPCPKCHAHVMANADIRDDPDATIGCPVCGTVYDYPQQVDSTFKTTEACPHCGKENRIPANKGNLKVTCGHCGEIFDFYSGETKILRSDKPKKTQQQKQERPAQQYQAEEQTEQKGFFASIKEMFDQHKEEAEQEAADILGSDLALYLKLALRDALLNREQDPKMRRFRAYRMYLHSSGMRLYGLELRGEPRVEGDHEALYIDFDRLPGTTKRVRHRLARRVLREDLLRSVHGLNDRYFVRLDDALIWKLSE